MTRSKGRLATIVASVAAAIALLGAVPYSAQEDIVPRDEIEATYRAQTQGKQLYVAKKYEEAIPYLEFAAQRGFKQAQAQLGQIYVEGLGNVKQDIAQGVGWLGAAAAGETEPQFKQLYDRVRAQIPKQHNETLDKIVETYKSNYDGRRTRVVCEMVARAGRHGRTLLCRYIDEDLYPGISTS